METSFPNIPKHTLEHEILNVKSQQILDDRYLLEANNLSDLENVATARTNLGLGTIATQDANNVAITGGSITGITDLAIVDGGTGASTAADARTNLGLVAGGAGDIWVEKAGDTMTGTLFINAGSSQGQVNYETGVSTTTGLIKGSPTLLTLNVVDDGTYYQLGYINDDEGSIGNWQVGGNSLLFEHNDIGDSTTGQNYLLYYGGYGFSGAGFGDTPGIWQSAASTMALGLIDPSDIENNTTVITIDGANERAGFGVVDPDTKVEILHAGNQLKLSFDGTDNAVFAVNTAGDLTITPSGTSTIFKSEVEAGGSTTKVKITSIGGVAIKLTNTTGANTVAGQTVKVDTTTDDAVILTAADDDECIGVFLDSGIVDDAEAWVVVSGIADVAMEDNTAATHGNWVETSDAEAGYANAESASPVAAPQHFNEIGHCIESVVAGGGGTHILARCVLHFN